MGLSTTSLPLQPEQMVRRRVTVNSTVQTIGRPLTPWVRFGVGSNWYISELLSGDNAKSTAGSRLAPLGTS